MRALVIAKRRREDILVLMREKKRTRGRELSARFGVSLRTIYSDMAALQLRGAPIAGFGGDGYVLLNPPKELAA